MSTLLVVQSFAPYLEMCQRHLHWWDRQGFPVVIISPEDSFCDVPGVRCERVGPEAHAGPASLERWRCMLRWCLEQPYDHFMMHESDSICLTKTLPAYLYRRPWTFFSNEMLDNRVPPEQTFYCVAPWFFHRSLAEQILAVDTPDRAPFHGDRWLGQRLEVGRINHARFLPGIGCGTIKPDGDLPAVLHAVRAGAFMIHGIKTPDVLAALTKS